MPERLVSTPWARMGPNSAGPRAIGQPQKVTRKASRGLDLTDLEHALHPISVPAQI